jgi:alkylresorcinol/alkylpyrone synthase
MVRPVSLLSIATAVPPHVVEQRYVAERARTVYAPVFERFPQIADVFQNAGIQQRYSVKPPDWFERPLDWKERTAAYLDGAEELFLAAAHDALACAHCAPGDVGVVITVSSTGIATPSLEARVAKRLGLHPNVIRVPVFGLGCAGGVTGLALGARLARAEPGKVVLVVVVEICTLALRRDRAVKADVIAAALFGDGAAAAVMQVKPEPNGALAIVGPAREHTWPSTLDIMGWNVDPIGFGVVLSRALPRFVEEKLAGPVRCFARSEGLTPGRFVCHPGGAKVLVAVEAALGLQIGTLADERTVLRQYGNMSAPTVMFVLKEALSKRLIGPAVLSALGPGFTASFLALEIGHG